MSYTQELGLWQNYKQTSVFSTEFPFSMDVIIVKNISKN